MATLKMRLLQMNDFGEFDTLYLETSARMVLLENGYNVQQSINNIEKYLVPSGTIVMWSGTVDTIPNGWLLCDGTNNTPDLRNKFIIGAGDTYTIGATGGEATHTLSIDEIPTHSHKVKYDSTGWVSIKTNSGTDGMLENTESSYDGQYSTSEVGSGLAHNNMPPYYALCYIMKA